jgi:hypothetical protein
MYRNAEFYITKHMDYVEKSHTSIKRVTSSVVCLVMVSVFECVFVRQHGQSQHRRKTSRKQDWQTVVHNIGVYLGKSEEKKLTIWRGRGVR